MKKYKDDKDGFENSRKSVRQSYEETSAYKDYKYKILKIRYDYVDAYEVISVTEQVNIFDRDKVDQEISKLKGEPPAPVASTNFQPVRSLASPTDFLY